MQIDLIEAIESIEKSKCIGGYTKYHYMAMSGDWKTDDIEILKISNRFGITVAHSLARNHPTWITDNKEVLQYKCNANWTVEDCLKLRKG